MKVFAKRLSKAGNAKINSNNLLLVRNYSQQQVTVDSYNSIIQSGLESSSVARVELTLKEMKEKGIHPNSVTKLLLVELANQQNDVKSALSNFEDLQKGKEEITDGAYTALLRNLARNREVKALPKVFSSIKKPSYKHYELAIKIYADAGDLDSAKKLYEEMKKNDVYINAPVYASLMKLTSSKKDVNSTAALWQEMRQKGIYPNLHHFDSLLFLYDSVGDSKAIDKTIEEINYFSIFPQGVEESESFAVSYIKKMLANKKNAPSSSSDATSKPSGKSQGYQSDPEKKKSKKNK